MSAWAEEGTVTVARQTLEGLREKRQLALAQIAELEVTRAKYDSAESRVRMRTGRCLSGPGNRLRRRPSL